MLIGFQFIITANQRKCLGIYFYYTEFFLNWGTDKHSAEEENKKERILQFCFILIHHRTLKMN